MFDVDTMSKDLNYFIRTRRLCMLATVLGILTYSALWFLLPNYRDFLIIGYLIMVLALMGAIINLSDPVTAIREILLEDNLRKGPLTRFKDVNTPVDKLLGKSKRELRRIQIQQILASLVLVTVGVLSIIFHYGWVYDS